MLAGSSTKYRIPARNCCPTASPVTTTPVTATRERRTRRRSPTLRPKCQRLRRAIHRQDMAKWWGNAPVWALALQEQCNASQDGQWALWGTDVMGTRGSISPDWIANTAYSVGTFMYPNVNNSNKYDWEVSTAGTSAATSGAEPNWNSCTTTCADG